ncbi:hypothetical protein [Staphylococcus sp. GDY8P199P]|uniref:hypothetical protein n=1 Tax=Staphylococcus sp. GDY8P199P TaxID=2804175 RepID=UPI001AEC4C0F|nr:hypothetical protein [Staphylococcus sp. GDY8P199P]
MKEIIKDILERHNTNFNEVSETISKAIEKYWDSINDIYTSLQDFSNYYDEVNILSISLDYPPIDYIDPIMLSEYFSEDLSERNISEIWDNAMLYYFDEYHIEFLEESIKNYNIPQKDIDILIEIVNGYKNDYYFLVITTLLTRIEGLFFKFFNYKGDARGKIKGLVTETIKKNKDNDKYISSSKEAYDSVIDFYENKLSRTFKYGDPNIMSDLKRHPIIHGYSNEYGTKINSIKLLLFYEYFYYSLCNLSKQDISDIKKKLNMTD